MLKAYSAFHGYSLGNQLAGLLQCNIRGIEPGPIDTYKGCQEKGRQVRKSEKAIWLCVPLTRKNKNQETGEEAAPGSATNGSDRLGGRFVLPFPWLIARPAYDGKPIRLSKSPKRGSPRMVSHTG